MRRGRDLAMVGEGSTYVAELRVSSSLDDPPPHRPGEAHRHRDTLTAPASSCIRAQALDPEDYIAVGLAQCFSLNSDNKLDRAFAAPPKDTTWSSSPVRQFAHSHALPALAVVLTACFVLEPLTAGTLETLAFGVPTSYKRVLALTCGQLFIGESRGHRQSTRQGRVGRG